MSDTLAPDHRAEILSEIYREVAKQAADLADVARDSEPDDDMAGAIKLLGNAMERIAMARCMAQCDAQDLAAKKRLVVPAIPDLESIRAEAADWREEERLARAQTAALDATEKALSLNVKVCHDCGHRTYDDLEDCPRCGAELYSDATEKALEPGS